MKKYPVTYKGELYEVRWETLGWFPIITIYKETTSRFLKRKIYKKIYVEYESIIDKHITISRNDPNYHIEQVKTIFKLFEQETEAKIKSDLSKQKQQQALAEWDGII